jgi:hypothetical protein
MQMSRRTKNFHRFLKAGDPAFLRLTEADFLIGLVASQYDHSGHRDQAYCLRGLGALIREMRDDMAHDHKPAARS